MVQVNSKHPEPKGEPKQHRKRQGHILTVQRARGTTSPSYRSTIRQLDDIFHTVLTNNHNMLLNLRGSPAGGVVVHLAQHSLSESGQPNVLEGQKTELRGQGLPLMLTPSSGIQKFIVFGCGGSLTVIMARSP